MPITAICPQGHSIKAPNDWVGRATKCPVCRESFVVGADSPPKAAAVPPPLKKSKPDPPSHHDDDPAAAPTERRQEVLRPGVLAKKTEALTPAKRLDEPRYGYHPPARRINAVYWLAAALVAFTLVSAIPALVWIDGDGEVRQSSSHSGLMIRHADSWQVSDSPAWARWTLLIVGLQLSYIAWMAIAPDFSTVRVMMWVFASVAGLYALAVAAVLFTGANETLILNLDSVRSSAAGWSAAMMFAMSLAAYLCGRMSHRWRSAYRRNLSVAKPAH